MTTSKIGLKLANGEFYPVLDEGSAARKRLVVTTVQDGQRSVQIDIYRGASATVAGAEYAGSLVIDNIPFAPKGEPDIRVDLGLDEDGKLTAYAEELSSGEHQSLEVSLEALTEENSYEIPDFAFEEETDSLPPEAESLTPGNEGSLLTAASAILDAESFSIEDDEPFTFDSKSPDGDSDEAGFDMETPDLGGPPSGRTPSPYATTYTGEEIVGEPVAEVKPRRKPLPVILFVLLVLAVVLGGAWLVYRFILTPQTGSIELAATTPAPAQPAPAQVAVQPAATPAAAATPAPAPAAAQTTPAAVATPPANATPPVATKPATPTVSPPANPAKKPGVYYKLRWGDTLWDLAYTFYRNPWLFGKIAKANKIKNPDFILAGKTVWIPPR